MAKFVLNRIENNEAELKMADGSVIVIPYDYLPTGLKLGDKLKIIKDVPQEQVTKKLMSERYRDFFSSR